MGNSSIHKIELPWSHNKRTDYLIPCKTCRTESIAVGNGLCESCMRELLTNAIINSIL